MRGIMPFFVPPNIMKMSGWLTDCPGAVVDVIYKGAGEKIHMPQISHKAPSILRLLIPPIQMKAPPAHLLMSTQPPTPPKKTTGPSRGAQGWDGRGRQGAAPGCVRPLFSSALFCSVRHHVYTHTSRLACIRVHPLFVVCVLHACHGHKPSCICIYTCIRHHIQCTNPPIARLFE